MADEPANPSQVGGDVGWSQGSLKAVKLERLTLTQFGTRSTPATLQFMAPPAVSVSSTTLFRPVRLAW